MADRGGGQLVLAVETVAEHIGDGPVMVHCAAGKDRTGMLVALIQAAIGVGLEEIVEEYALSDVPSRTRRRAMIDDPLPDDPPVARAPEYLWAAPAEAMDLFARGAIETYGSLPAWPRALGVSEGAVERLTSALVVEAP